MSRFPSRALAYAIRRPLDDQAGSDSLKALFFSRSWPVPLGGIV